MKEFLKLAGTLCIITFAAAAMLCGVNAVTEDRIAEEALKKKTNAMQTLLPEADAFTEVNEDISMGSSGSETAGYCVSTASAGYGGDIEIMVGIDAEGIITGVEILDNSETAGLGANCTKPEFKAQFKGVEYPATVVKGSAADGQISAITGATITSNAVASGVNHAFDMLKEAGIELQKGGR